MSFKDRTFCASPNCNNKCGRKMPEKWQKQLADLLETYYWSAQVSYGYFCDKPDSNEDTITKKD